eukprot:Rmarinus@m.6364
MGDIAEDPDTGSEPVLAVPIEIARKGELAVLQRRQTVHDRPLFSIPSTIRTLVSGRNKRYQDDGFDLDLTYITKRIIAMGFPSSGMEGAYRNPLPEVVEFLKQKHKEKWYVFNMCSERKYPDEKMENRITRYPFDDHNPPALGMIRCFCTEASAWLSKDPENIVAVHCKAGKGRTGTMVSCLLLHLGFFHNARDALRWFSTMRTKDQRGVTIPSQRRYVGYYAEMLRYGAFIRPRHRSLVPMRTLVACHVEKLCYDAALEAGSAYVRILVDGEEVYRSSDTSAKEIRIIPGSPLHKGIDDPALDAIEVTIPNLSLRGDVRIELWRSQMFGDEELYHLWFHTAFLPSSEVVPFTYKEVDLQKKPKSPPLGDRFAVQLVFAEKGSPFEKLANRLRRSSSSMDNDTSHRRRSSDSGGEGGSHFEGTAFVPPTIKEDGPGSEFESVLKDIRKAGHGKVGTFDLSSSLEPTHLPSDSDVSLKPVEFSLQRFGEGDGAAVCLNTSPIALSSDRAAKLSPSGIDDSTDLHSEESVEDWQLGVDPIAIRYDSDLPREHEGLTVPADLPYRSASPASEPSVATMSITEETNEKDRGRRNSDGDELETELTAKDVAELRDRLRTQSQLLADREHTIELLKKEVEELQVYKTKAQAKLKALRDDIDCHHVLKEGMQVAYKRAVDERIVAEQMLTDTRASMSERISQLTSENEHLKKQTRQLQYLLDREHAETERRLSIIDLADASSKSRRSTSAEVPLLHRDFSAHRSAEGPVLIGGVGAENILEGGEPASPRLAHRHLQRSMSVSVHPIGGSRDPPEASEALIRATQELLRHETQFLWQLQCLQWVHKSAQEGAQRPRRRTIQNSLDMDGIFFNVDPFLDVHASCVELIRKSLNLNSSKPTRICASTLCILVGKGVLSVATRVFRYKEYARNFPEAVATLSQLRGSKEVQVVLEECDATLKEGSMFPYPTDVVDTAKDIPECSTGAPDVRLSTLLYSPLQYLPKFIHLVRAVLRNADFDVVSAKADLDPLWSAVTMLECGRDEILEEMTDADNVLRVLRIEEALVGGQLSQYLSDYKYLAEKGRVLVHEGVLIKVNEHHQRQRRHFFLFSDMLVWAIPRTATDGCPYSYQLRGACWMTGAQLLERTGPTIRLNSKKKTYTLVAPTPEGQTRWVQRLQSVIDRCSSGPPALKERSRKFRLLGRDISVGAGTGSLVPSGNAGEKLPGTSGVANTPDDHGANLHTTGGGRSASTSSHEGTIKSSAVAVQIPFMTLIMDPALHVPWMEFLKQELSEENMEFTMAIDIFKHKHACSSSVETMMSDAETLYATFIEPGGAKEINIQFEIRSRTKALFKSQAPAHLMFRECERGVTQLMYKDTYPRFRKTPTYRRCVLRFSSPPPPSVFGVALSSLPAVRCAPSGVPLVLNRALAYLKTRPASVKFDAVAEWAVFAELRSALNYCDDVDIMVLSRGQVLPVCNVVTSFFADLPSPLLSDDAVDSLTACVHLTSPSTSPSPTHHTHPVATGAPPDACYSPTTSLFRSLHRSIQMELTPRHLATFTALLEVLHAVMAACKAKDGNDISADYASRLATTFYPLLISVRQFEQGDKVVGGGISKKRAVIVALAALITHFDEWGTPEL